MAAGPASPPGGGSVMASASPSPPDGIGGGAGGGPAAGARHWAAGPVGEGRAGWPDPAAAAAAATLPSTPGTPASPSGLEQLPPPLQRLQQIGMSRFGWRQQQGSWDAVASSDCGGYSARAVGLPAPVRVGTSHGAGGAMQQPAREEGLAGTRVDDAGTDVEQVDVVHVALTPIAGGRQPLGGVGGGAGGGEARGAVWMRNEVWEE